jgi:hypothetical protein
MMELKITGNETLYSTRDGSSGYVETPLSLVKAEILIFHDAEHPFYLPLPVIQEVSEISPVKPLMDDAVPGALRFT